VIGIAFTVDNYFLPTIPPAYVPYCPDALRTACATQPVRDQIGLMGAYTVMAVGLTGSVIGNRLFGHEKTNFYREASSGIDVTAYFMGKCLSDIPFIVLYAFVYCISYYTVASPASKFSDFYQLLLTYEFVMLSVGYVASCLFEEENALLLSVVASFLAGLASDRTVAISWLAWSLWLQEGLFTAEARLDLASPQLQALIVFYGNVRYEFDIGVVGRDAGVLILFGVIFRLLSYAILRYHLKRRELTA